MRIDWATSSERFTAQGRLGPRNVLQFVAGAGCAFLVGLIVVRANLEVVREGDLFGYGPVKEIELFGRYSLYKDAQPVGALDTLNAFLLVSIASTTFFVAALLHAADRWFGFFLATSCGAAFFAADETLGLHESVGLNLRFLADLPGIRHPDDVIYALYMVPVVFFAYAFRRQITSSRRALTLFLLGGALFAASAALDVTAVRGEEFVEILATLVLLAAFADLAFVCVRRTFVTKA